MKKLIAMAMLAGVVSASAVMDDRDFAVTVIATATNSATYVLRGELQGIFVEVPTGKTGTVTVASEQVKLFEKADIAASAYFPVRLPVVDTAGAAITYVAGTTNAVVAPAALAGPITATVVGAGTGTNTWNIKLIYKK